MISGTVLSPNSSICQAAGENPAVDENLTVGEVYNTAVEAAYGDTFRSVYENHLAGSPLEAGENDGVDTATGHLMLSRNDLSLDGTGGMDFELGRYYDSNEANLGHATVEYTNKLEVDTIWVNYTAADGSQRRIIVNAAVWKNHKKALKNLLATYEKGEGRRGVSFDGKPDYEEKTQRTKIVSNERHNVYGLASGWRYDFPWIETVTLTEKEGWGKEPRYLHYGSAGVMNLVYDRRKVADFKATFDVSASRGGELTADADLFVDGTRTVTVRGIINQADSTATSPLALDFSMIKFPLATANPFLPRSAGSLGGTLNGTLKISGSPDAPVFDGFLAFDQAAATVGMLGTTFTFSDKRIPVVNNMATLDTFAITGSNANPLTIDGSVDLSNLSDLGLDLRLEASDMMLVNSRKPSRDAVVYGKAYIDLDAKVRGSMASMLTVDADLALLPETNVTYVMETTSSELVNRSSGEMVKFVSFADSTAVAKADSIQPAGMLLLVDADLDIQTGSIINVDLDPQGNNKIQIESDGNLSFAMTPMNSGRLTGRLNIDKGFARYGMPPVLGEQTFRFVRGSYVAFSGDMMNPTLNIHATNTVKSNVTQEGQNSRLVNFDIGLSVTGTLERMDVAFDLSTRDDMTVANELESMSAEQRANQAINLMLYHTYTGGGTKGSGISNPLYSFLAGQLNNWAANTIKGVDISFGIDQYDRTVNGSTSQTTSYSYQVSKSLFNDRFKIVVGGNYSTDANADENFSQNLISDISFEYFLNSARSMYIRLFRHTGYESILEGEITQTGVGFVYRRKLSRLSDMFLPPRLVEKRHKRQQLDMDRQQAPAAKKSQQ